MQNHVGVQRCRHFGGKHCLYLQHKRLKATRHRISEDRNRNSHRRENLRFHVCGPDEHLAR
jgi:hypothetical protein